MNRTLPITTALVLLATSLACGMAEVAGERNGSNGDCPVDEVCSDATPAGLMFVGQVFYDDPAERLGPMVKGGVLEIAYKAPFDEVVSSAEVQVEGPLALTPGDGMFGEADSTASDYAIQGWATIVGTDLGTGFVRVVESRSGALYDRLPIDVVEVDDAQIGHAWDPERTHVRAGCDELLAVRLMAGDEATRLFDQDMSMSIDQGDMEPDPVMWDCVRLVPPMDQDEVTVTLDSGGKLFTRTFPVRTLEEDGLTECPDPHG